MMQVNKTLNVRVYFLFVAQHSICFGLSVFLHYPCITPAHPNNRQCITSLSFSGVKGILVVYNASAKHGYELKVANK
jgi:hypothetical protein